MKNFDEVTWAVLSVYVFVIFVAIAVTYSEQQQRALFQQTYNKNLECRQALKDQTVGRITDICGTVPVIGDFVK
jgi:cell division protein FtsL